MALCFWYVWWDWARGNLGGEIAGLAQQGKNELRSLIQLIALSNAILWAGPFVLIAFGVGIFLVMVRRKRAVAEKPRAEVSSERSAELEKLLADRGETR